LEYRFRFDNFKQIIGTNGSHLQLSSEIGIGSTFYFDLDLQTTDDNEVETLLEIDKEDIVDAFAFHSNDRLEALKVMLVEDNKINMLLLKQ
jgi:hypothetical protein